MNRDKLISDAAEAVDIFGDDELEQYAQSLRDAFERGYNDRKTGHEMDKPLQPGARYAYVKGYRQAEREVAR